MAGFETKTDGDLCTSMEKYLNKGVSATRKLSGTIIRKCSISVGDTDTQPSQLIPSETASCTSNEDVPIPPDGGYGYVIIFAAFVSNIVVDGIVYSFGSLKESVYEGFKSQTRPGEPEMDQATVAWVGSTLIGFYSMMGPIVSAVANKWGFRVVAVVGGLMASSGLILAWYLNLHEANMAYLCVFYGIVAGSGFSCIYVPAVIAVGFYFDKKRALATGIAVCGSGVGNFIFPPLIALLISHWQWQGAILGLGLIVLICALLGLLYKPLKPPSAKAKDKEEKKRNVLNKLKEWPHQRFYSFWTEEKTSKLPVVGRFANTVWTVNEMTNPQAALPKPLPETDVSNNSLRIQDITQKPLTTTTNCPNSDANSRKSVDYPKPTKPSLPRGKLESSCCGPCASSLCKTITSLWDFSLLLSPSFLIMSISSMFAVLGLLVPFDYLMDHAKIVLTDGQNVPEKSTLALLLSMIGAANIVGRIVSGWLADRPCINVLMLNNTAITIMGVSTAVVPCLSQYYQFMIFSCVFGCTLACFHSLRSILLIEFLGLDKLTNAFGLLLMFLGIAGNMASPVAGTIVTASGSTNDFSVAFFFGGGCLVFSAMMCYPLNVINRWEKKRNNRSRHVSFADASISSS